MNSKVRCGQFLTITGALVALFLGLPQLAHATDSVDCNSTCDSGNKMVSYADGNTITCACVAEGQMEATVPDPAVQEGEVHQDAE